ENEEDQVVGMDVIGAEDEYVINLTEYGYGKKTSVNMYNVQKRGGAGVYTVRITKKTGDLVGIRVVKKTDDLMVISSSGQIIRFNVTQMRTTRARSAQGVKAIRMNKGEYLVDFTRYVGDEPEE
ncbi:MAG: DNA gyrase C-terminal beta-propeller domain-containing protein, partial [Thermodesulfobacteriota bacterium]|nr:DNA gyrase C-terminal beta-propeller domain-containing protein [Thermodesulfobacteriota bacterium]